MSWQYEPAGMCQCCTYTIVSMHYMSPIMMYPHFLRATAVQTTLSDIHGWCPWWVSRKSSALKCIGYQWLCGNLCADIYNRLLPLCIILCMWIILPIHNRQYAHNSLPVQTAFNAFMLDIWWTHSRRCGVLRWLGYGDHCRARARTK